MNLKVYFCEGAEYSDRVLDVKVKQRVLFHPLNGTLEVEYKLLPEIKAHSGGRFNVMFIDKNEEVDLNDRKYFSKITLLQRFNLIWMYSDFWIQKTENQWRIILFVLGLLGGYVLRGVN